MSKALVHFERLIGDVDNLIAHHPKSGSPLAGRPATDEGPLLRSCVVLTYGAWEVYFEDSLVEAAQTLAEGDRGDLPAATVAWVRAETADSWALADDGWRKQLVKLVDHTMHGDPDDPQSFGVNTASPKTVSTWTWTILGWRTLEHCGWKNATNRTIKAKLDRLVTLRGDIAHGGRPDRLALANVRDYRDFTERLARAYDAELFSFVASTRSTLASLEA